MPWLDLHDGPTSVDMMLQSGIFRVRYLVMRQVNVHDAAALVLTIVTRMADIDHPALDPAPWGAGRIV